MTVCLEAPPGSGKGALLARLREEHPSVRASTYRPPLALCEACQDEPGRWDLLLQLRVLVDRCREVAAGHEVMVGSPLSDVACHARLAAMHPQERRLYEGWAAVLCAGLPAVRHVLLDGSPEASFREVVTRGRREQASATHACLEAQHGAYGETFAGCERIPAPPHAADTPVLLQPAVRALWRACGTSPPKT